MGSTSEGLVYFQQIEKVAEKLNVELVTTIEYKGACDASAIVSTKGGFLAASDERVWWKGEERNVLFSFGLEGRSPKETMALETPEEMDIEAAARDYSNKLIYWIGSLSTDRKKKQRSTPRECLFRTDEHGARPSKCVPKLKEAVCDKLNLGEQCLSSDIAVEGMTMMNGNLVLGLRRELDQTGKAVLLELKASSLEFGSNDSSPEIVKVHTLDLDGRGIRAMESARDKKGQWVYYVIAGPTARTNHENYKERDKFALYRWSGDQGNLDKLDFPFGSAGGAFEGLMVDEKDHLWVSRDSDHLTDKLPCKDRVPLNPKTWTPAQGYNEHGSFLLLDLGPHNLLRESLRQ